MSGKDSECAENSEGMEKRRDVRTYVGEGKETMWVGRNKRRKCARMYREQQERQGKEMCDDVCIGRSIGEEGKPTLGGGEGQRVSGGKRECIGEEQ